MASSEPVTIPALQQMKRDGKKIVGVVAWDYQIAQITDRAGVDIISVGDTVGINLWGQPNPLEVTMDEMLVVLQSGAARHQARARLLRLSVRPGAGGRRLRGEGRHPARQGRRRRPDQARRRGRFPRSRHRDRARRHPGVRAVRHHAADRAAIRHGLQRAEQARRAGDRRRRPPSSSTKPSGWKTRARSRSTSPIPARSPAPPW